MGSFSRAYNNPQGQRIIAAKDIRTIKGNGNSNQMVEGELY